MLVAYGMHNSVVCAEDVPNSGIRPEASGELEKTYLGTAQLDALQKHLFPVAARAG